MEIIKFDKKDLLSFVEIENLIISVRPNEKAKIISNKMLNYLLINNGNFYRFDIDKILYIKENNNDDYVITLITLFIDKSYEQLQQKDQEIIQLKYKKSFDKIFLNSDVNKYLPQLMTYLTNNKINFKDPHLYQIHFQNGYFNFKTGKFEKRINGIDFINVHISRDYIKPKKEDIKLVFKDINKIYPSQEDRDYLLMTFGQATTGQACSEQTMLFLLGLGSSGKSTILELYKLSLEDYVFTLPKQTFSRGYSKIDKILNTYMLRPCIRLSHINEMEDTKMDCSLFKDYTDGKIQTTTLYADGSNDFQHYSKMVITANTFPNIKIDSGSIRRIDSYTHVSKFVKDISEVNEKNNIYLANKDFLNEKKHNSTYLNAFFYIIADYGYKWITKESIYKQTNNFNNTKAAIVTSNDIIQDFLDKEVTITNKDDDRIGRDIMYDTFKFIYPKSMLTPGELLNSLKQKEISYKPDCRHNKLKGCYVGIVFGEVKNKHETKYEFGKQDMELKTKNDELINLNKSMSEELEKIKKEMEELKAELNKPKVKKTIQTRKQINIIIRNDEELETKAVEEIQNLKNSILDLI